VSALDQQLQAMREAWEAVARYRVIRDDVLLPAWSHRRTELAAGLTLAQARAMEEGCNAVISALDPFTGSGGSMSRSVVCIELEKAPMPPKVCACGCGVAVTGKARLAAPACRKREQRRRALQIAIGNCDSRPQASGPEELGP
jgi:hypothetical protein